MKTYQLILATALVALSACTKEEIVNNGSTLDNEIGFRAVTSMNTKANDAIISGNTYDEENSFRLWGWQSQKGDFSEFIDDDESNFMTNLKIEYCDGPQGRSNAWRNDDHYYYWPFTGKLSFLAIHPYEIASATTGWDETNDVPQAAISDYTITPGSNETVDLMFATNEGTRMTSALPMVFNHALSQIEVQVKTDKDYSADVEFDVLGITFHNIDLSGDVTYANKTIEWTDNTDQDDEWVYYNTKKYSEQYAENNVPVYVSNAYKVYGAAKVNIPQQESVHDQPATEAIIEGTYITVEYTMKQYNSAMITGTVNIAKPQEWLAGKRYVYTINFRLNEILFNPSVTDWVEVGVETINIY